MAIQWSSQSGKLRVGIDISFSSVTSSSTSVTVTIDYWVQVVNWRYNDQQSLNYNDPTTSGTNSYGFLNYQASTTTTSFKVLTRSYNQSISYSGGPTHSASASISGAYDGSSPSLTRSYTIPARPASVPSAPNCNIDQVTSSSMRTTLSGTSSNGSSILEYQIQLDNSSGFGSPVGTFSTSQRTWSGLSAATTYYARGRARNSVGWGAWSSTDSATTGATTPGTPTGVSAGSIGQESVSVSWSAPSTNGGSAITKYQVQYATNSGFSTGVSTFDDTSSPHPRSGLTPSTTYWVRVRAVNGVGAGSWSSAVSFTTLTATPSVYAPSQSSTTSRGWAYAEIEAAGITSSREITVQFSTDSTFTTVNHTVTLNPTGPTANNRYVVQDTTKLLLNGTWYARAQVTNTATSYVTPWSATRTFAVSHTPAVVTVSPAAGSTLIYSATQALSFQFSDPSSIDRITAYEIAVERNSDGTSVFSSGKTSMTGTANPQTISIGVPIPSTEKGEALRWRVRVWDLSDQASTWTGYSIFTPVDPPTVTILIPANASTVDNGAPTFEWDVTIPSGGTQSQAVLEVRQSSNNNLVYSNTVTGSGKVVVPDRIILANNRSYFVKVTVTDSFGLSGNSTSTFSTSYDAPLPVAYDFNGWNVNELGYAEIMWPNADADALFTAWKVYRLEASDPEAQWELIYETGDQNVHEYRDYLVKSGADFSYSVTQVAYRSGALLESPVGYYVDSEGVEQEELRYSTTDISTYWLIDTENPDNSVQLPVISDDNTLDFEMETFTLIGRGRHVDYGDELGYSGSLVCQIRGTERQSSLRMHIEKLRRTRSTYWLRTPYGRLFQVALGNLGWSPLPGTGTSEMGDLTIPYEQVA